MHILEKILEFLRELIGCPQEPQNEIRGKIMYIVKADNPAVGFEIMFDTFDSEGNQVPEDSLDIEVVSDNEDAVAVEFDESAQSGTVSFGNPGLANMNVTVKDANGELLGSFGAQFTVTVGDPASISGGDIVFDGLEEAEAPAPTEEAPAEEVPAEVPAEGFPNEEVPVAEPAPINEEPVNMPSEEPTEEPVGQPVPVEEMPSPETPEEEEPIL